MTPTVIRQPSAPAVTTMIAIGSRIHIGVRPLATVLVSTLV
jgi:hypothetical protein